jgi:hypothetical protein
MLEECLKVYNEMEKIMQGKKTTGKGSTKSKSQSSSSSSSKPAKSKSKTLTKSKIKPLTRSQLKDFKSIQLKMLEELKEKATWLSSEQRRALNKALREREPKLFYDSHPSAEEVLAERK